MTDSKVQANAAKRMPPNAGKGKKPGTLNKTTKMLKEAIIEAAEAIGEDGKGKAGLVGYLKAVARADKKSFSMLLGKVLPLQLSGVGGGPIPVASVACTLDEFQAIAAAMAREV